MSFFTDLRDAIVADASISAEYDTRRYFQLLPRDIDKSKTWLRWGFTRGEEMSCMGGGTAQYEYEMFIDVMSKTINDLPNMGDEIIENFDDKSFGGITNINFINDLYTNYQERDIFARTLNFTATYR